MPNGAAMGNHAVRFAGRWVLVKLLLALAIFPLIGTLLGRFGPSLFFEMTLKSSAPFVTELWYDIGTGLSNRHVSAKKVPGSAAKTVVRLRLPKQRIKALRYYPSSGGVPVEISTVKVINKSGDTVLDLWSAGRPEIRGARSFFWDLSRTPLGQFQWKWFLLVLILSLLASIPVLFLMLLFPAWADKLFFRPHPGPEYYCLVLGLAFIIALWDWRACGLDLSSGTSVACRLILGLTSTVGVSFLLWRRRVTPTS